MNKIEIGYDELVFDDREFEKIVDDMAQKMDVDEVLSCILQICKTSEKNEPGALEKATPLYKNIYIAREMYKYGFASALYLYNESMKEFFERKQV